MQDLAKKDLAYNTYNSFLGFIVYLELITSPHQLACILTAVQKRFVPAPPSQLSLPRL